MHITPQTKRWILVAAAAAIALAVAAFFVLRDVGPSSSPSPSPSPTSTVLPPNVARDLEADLSSGDSARIRKALSVPKKEKLDPSLLSNIASLGRITIREGTAVLLDDNSMRVYADVENSDAKVWTLLLTREGSSWVVASTLEGEQK